MTEKDERALAAVRESSDLQSTLADLSSLKVDPNSVSEAALLHAILEVGFAALRDAADEAGYAQVAGERRPETDDRKAQARRRPPSWAADE